MTRVPKLCTECGQTFWCDLAVIEQAIHGCRGETQFDISEKNINYKRTYSTEKTEKIPTPIKTYKASDKTKKIYKCLNCGDEIESKNKRVYCTKKCYNHHRIKLANDKWIKRQYKRKKPASWVNGALNMRSTRQEAPGFLKKFKSVRG